MNSMKDKHAQSMLDYVKKQNIVKILFQGLNMKKNNDKRNKNDQVS